MVGAVERALGDGRAWGVTLRYAVESEPLGTGGGVRNAANLVADLVVVLNGDVLSDVDLGAMLRSHRARGAAATIYLTRVQDPTAYGLVETGTDGRVRRFLEKPPADQVTTDTVNAGAYVLDRRLIERIATDRPVSIEREFFPSLLDERVPFHAWVQDSYWLDIGSPAKYRQASLDLLAGLVSTEVRPPGVAAGRRWIGEGLAAEPGARVVPPVVIGPGCRLQAGCRVGPSVVVGARCAIGRDVVVENAVLWDDVSVGAGATLRGTICGSGVRIGARAALGEVVLESGVAVLDDARLPG
jgi:NDP-sugar pyrophosphorylase family protein